MSFPPVTLNDGNTIPPIGYGLGTARFKATPGALDETIVSLTVTAIKSGFTHLDGAECYGNEEELGKAIRDSGVPRSSLFVTTKFLAGEPTPAEPTLRTSLQKLGLDYIDLYLIHQPFFAKGDATTLQAKWAEVEALKDAGLARSIGVSNYLQGDLEAVLATARIRPAVNQIEFHAYLQHGDLLDFHRKERIVTQAYGSLIPLVRAAEVSGGRVKGIWERLADKYGVSASEVGLRWVLDQGVVALTTSAREERLKGYLAKLPTFKLTEEEIKEINEAGREQHYRAFWRDVFAADDRR